MSGINKEQLMDILKTSNEVCPNFGTMTALGIAEFDREMGGDGKYFEKIAKELKETE